MSGEILRPGSRLDERFELKRLLGTGSTGEVWLAADLDGRSVAIKALSELLRADRSAVEQLAREARVLSSLVHPNVARSLFFQAEGPQVYIAMEYVEGRPLDEEIGARAAALMFFTPAELARLFAELCAGVAHAHAKFIVHRDLKPQNVMLLPQGPGPRIKVLDFGVAKLLEGSRFDATTFGRQVGSLFYMSPEQTRGQPAEPPSDVFALGTVLFELLTLRRAWAWDNDGLPLIAFNAPVPRNRANALSEVVERIQRGPRPRVAAVRPDLPQELDEVLARVWAADPSQRPGSALALADEVRRALERATTLVGPTPGPPTVAEGEVTFVVAPEPRIEADQRGTFVEGKAREERGTLVEPEPFAQPERPTDAAPVPYVPTSRVPLAELPRPIERAAEPRPASATPLEPWLVSAPVERVLLPAADETHKLPHGPLHLGERAPTLWSPWARRVVLGSVFAISAAGVVVAGLLLGL